MGRLNLSLNHLSNFLDGGISGLHFTLLFITFSFSGSSVFCQPDFAYNKKEELVIARIDGQIVFDGVPDEQAWSSIVPVNLTMHSPTFGKNPSERSDVRIAYDDQYLYVGASLLCDDPSQIRSASLKRDFMGQVGDFFGIILDTYNDKENGVMFLTTPDALRIDASIQRDALINNSNKIPYNVNWNTFWDVRTSRSDQGWSAEIRIPISSLRFQENNGLVKMGIIIQRWIPAKNEMDVYPAIPPAWGTFSVLKPSQANEVIFHDIHPQSPFYLTPYLLAGYNRNYVLNADAISYVPDDDPKFEAGLDIKYGITSNLTMDISVNTDFAQVESDDQQVNLSRFSLYFPEKRIFFLERASAFDFSFGGNNNMFYSRRIGLSEDGKPVRIYGGFRLTGRLGKWDLGILNMQTAAFKGEQPYESENISQPSENFAALRLRRQVINSNSFIGTMLTTRLGMNGNYNFVFGVDGLFRMFGDDYLDIKIARSSDSDLTETSLIGSTRLMAVWERRSKVGLGYEFGYSYVGTNYEPGMGFERLLNYGYYKSEFRYGWLKGEQSILYRHAPGLEFKYFHYAHDGSLMTYETKALWNFETKSKWVGEISSAFGLENLKDTLYLQGDEVFISPGRYNNLMFVADITTPDSKPMYVNTLIESGNYFQGFRFSWKIQPTWNASRHLELGGIYSFDYVEFLESGQWIRNHIVGIKALVMIDTRLSFNGFIQYNTGQNLISSNLRFRYNPKEGNDIYLVFNEGRSQDLDAETPRLPRYNIRSFMLKYTYTFTF